MTGMRGEPSKGTISRAEGRKDADQPDQLDIRRGRREY
jgi:hypothetical protein